MGPVSPGVAAQVAYGDLRDVVHARSVELGDRRGIGPDTWRRVVEQDVEVVRAEAVGVGVVKPNRDLIDPGKVVRDIGSIGDLLAAVP